MTSDERRKLSDASVVIASVRNAMVYRNDYRDIHIMEQILNEISTILENDSDRKKLEETDNGDEKRYS